MQVILKSVLSFSLKAMVLLGMLTVFLAISYFILIRPAYKSLIQEQVFSVDGTAKKYQKPDLAIVSVGAQFSGTDAATIKKDADKALNTTRTEVIALGIAEDKIQSNYSIQPKYDTNYQNITGYTARATMSVKTGDFTLVDKVLESAQKNKLILVDGVSFTIEDQIKAKEDLRTAAIDAAKAKAQKLAQETGISLGKVINISEGYNPYPMYLNSMKANTMIGSAPEAAVDQSSSTATFSPGETEVQMTVTLTYELY